MIPFRRTLLAAWSSWAVLLLSMTAHAALPSSITPQDQGEKVYLRLNYDEDASHLVGRFFPDEIASEQLKESDAMQTLCSTFIRSRSVSASGTTEEIRREGKMLRRIQYTAQDKLLAEIDEKGLFECCKANPGQCTRRYVDSIIRGELFDRTSAHGREVIRETKGAQYFGFTVATSAQSATARPFCDKAYSWMRKLPAGTEDHYFVGEAPNNELAEPQAREAALGRAKVRAQESIQKIFESARNDVESSFGNIELTNADRAELSGQIARFAARLTPECWYVPLNKDPSAQRGGGVLSVLTQLSSTSIEAAQRFALNFYGNRTAGTIEAANASALDELISRLPAAAEPLSVAIEPIPAAVGSAARADWAAIQMASAISQRHERFILKELPVSWKSGSRGLPPGVRLLLSARLAEKGGMLEISWGARVSDPKHGVRLVQLKPMTLALGLVPKNDALPLKGSTGGFSLWAEPLLDESLCPGGKYTLHIQSKARRHLQIWNLHGKDGAQAVLVYPANPGEGVIEAGQTLLLENLTPLPREGRPGARYLAIGAETPKALGKLARFSGCRLDASKTRKLLNAKDLNAPKRKLAVAQDGFQTEESDTCVSVARTNAQSAAAAIGTIPLCR